MKKYTAVLFIIFNVYLNAQGFKWVETQELDIQFNPAFLRTAITIDDSANPVYACLIEYKETYSAAYYGNVEIKKVTPAAELIWADTLFGGVDIKQIISDSENNIICLGSYTDTIRIGNSSLTRIGSGVSAFILKLDQQGNVVWLKDGSDYVTGFSEVTLLAKTGTNNFMLGIGSYTVVTNILTVNSAGNIISNIAQTHTGTISDIVVDVNKNIWCTGFTFGGYVSFNGTDTTAPYDYNDYVVKYDSSGNAQWISFIKDFTVQEFKLAADDSGYIYLSGNLLAPTDFGNLSTHGPQRDYDYFITKIDQDGNYIWVNEIPQGNNQGDATVGNGDYLSGTKNGDTYLAGFFRGQIDFGNNMQISNSGFGNYDVFVIKYDKNGKVQFVKSAGGSLYDFGSAAAADENGNFYVTGLIQGNTMFDTISVFANDNSLFVSKAGTNSITSSDEIKNELISAEGFKLFQNYPNPFSAKGGFISGGNPSTRIQYQVPGSSHITLKVYDILGEEVATLVNEEKPAGKYEVNFNASNLSSGVYYYKLWAGQYTKTRKMIYLK